MRSSQKAVDIIVNAEIGSREQYDKTYCRPTWPGGKSGVTIGIGYDLGYTTPAKVAEDFGHFLPSVQIVALQHLCGIKGPDAARAISPAVKSIIIPFAVAMQVFEKVDYPRYEAMLLHYCPGSEDLHPDCFGALGSIVYNRGAGGFTEPGDRFVEMRRIRQLVSAGRCEGVPEQIRAMKRLWDPRKQRGLIIRREHEAKLFEEGLKPLPDWLGKPKVTPPSNPAPEPEPEPEPTPAPVPVPEEDPRPHVTAKDLSGVVKWVDHVWWQKFWAYMLGLPSATVGVFKYIFGEQANLTDYMGPVKDFFAGIPPELYFVVVAGIAAAIFIQAKRTQDATVEAYRNGDLK